MNPYGAPRSRLADAEAPALDEPAWLDRNVRLAILVPPLLSAPLALALGSVAALPAPSLTFIVSAAYVVHITYGTLCYLVLRRLRALRFLWIVVAALLPFLLATLIVARSLAEALPMALYALFGLVIAVGSWYFAVFRKQRRKAGDALRPL